MSKIDRALQTAVKPGAQVTLPKMSVPGVGAVAAIIDPQENICGLWQQEVSAYSSFVSAPFSPVRPFTFLDKAKL
jgi:hypothetical protein